MRGGIMYNQKDIVLIPFPYSDLTGSKQRPALIVSNEKINKTNDRICCLITSNQPEEAIKIKKEHFNEGKLPFQSWIKPYRLFTINEKIIKKKICSINQTFHTRILKEINECLK
jgi:mRNA interferase MazF